MPVILRDTPGERNLKGQWVSITFFRVAFPMLFLSFHLVYWTLLISVSEVI